MFDEDEHERKLLKRITHNPQIYGGKAIIRGRRLAVDHVLGMMIGGSSREEILDHFDWLESDDITACLLYAQKLVERERVGSLAESAK
ncbi:MAG TPA: DUF433 domain-containing protein [Thermoanaerobaculia bacterium]